MKILKVKGRKILKNKIAYKNYLYKFDINIRRSCYKVIRGWSDGIRIWGFPLMPEGRKSHEAFTCFKM